jgi:hypothetical protein
MKVQYVAIVGGTPLVVPLDNDVNVFNVSIRTDATTVEFSLEAPTDLVARNTFSPARNTIISQTWVAAPAAVNGVVNLLVPAAAIRLSKASNGLATIIQQGLV